MDEHELGAEDPDSMDAYLARVADRVNGSDLSKGDRSELLAKIAELREKLKTVGDILTPPPSPKPSPLKRSFRARFGLPYGRVEVLGPPTPKPVSRRPDPLGP